MKKLNALFALLAMPLFQMPAMGAPPDGPASSIAVYAGGAFMREYFDGCGYYSNFCGGYNQSDTYSGPEFGIDASFVLPAGFLIDQHLA